MPVSGLLLTIDDGCELALRAALEADARTTAGERHGPRLVVALETVDAAADAVAWDWLRGLPGVRWVDLVWISLDPGDTVPARPPKNFERERDAAQPKAIRPIQGERL